MVSTPDRPSCSASSHTPKVLTNCRMIAVGTCCTRSSTRCVSQPSAGPGDEAADHREQEGRRHRLRPRSCRPRPRRPPGGRSAARWRRSAGFRLRGSSGCGAAGAAGAAPRSPPTASGGATTAPSATPAAHGSSGTSACATTATAAVVSPTANDDQADDRRPVVAQVARRGVVGRIEQDRRDEQRQRQLRRQRESARRARRPAARRRAPGTPDTARRAPRGAPPAHGGNEQDQDLFEFLHGCGLSQKNPRG